jgi:DNA processing protein
MNIYDLWFCSVKLSNRIKLSLIKEFVSTKEIWDYSNSFDKILFSSKEENKIKGFLKSSWNVSILENLLNNAMNDGINLVTFNDELYPQKLKYYEDSPSMLFYKGNIKKLNEEVSIGVVGSRDCSVYGRNAANLICKEFSLNNINIISGMARGIDACAHECCIQNQGYTCAVLGSGIDVIYPKQNKKIYNSICESGCIISEFLPGTPPNSYNFPIRNRIISGLSDAIIVVEASEKSGSLITASIALEQGKDVIAVPGSIFSTQSKGSNKLIKDGAYPFTDFEDLFEFLNIRYTEKKDLNIVKLEGLQQKIHEIIGNTPMHIDDIFGRTNIDIKRLYEVLFELQLKNEIICLSGNYYVKVESRV